MGMESVAVMAMSDFLGLQTGSHATPQIDSRRIAFSSMFEGTLPVWPLHRQVKAEVPAGVTRQGEGVQVSATQPGLCLSHQPVEPVSSFANSCQRKQGHCGAPGRLMLNCMHLPDGFIPQRCSYSSLKILCVSMKEEGSATELMSEARPDRFPPFRSAASREPSSGITL